MDLSRSFSKIALTGSIYHKRSVQFNLKILIFTWCLISTFLHANCQPLDIDSLEHAIEKEGIHDTIRINTIIELCKQHRRKNPYKALEVADRGLKLSYKINFRAGISKILAFIGNIHTGQGNYDSAIDFLTQALNINYADGRKMGIALCLGNIGIVFQNRGDYEKSIDYYLQSIRLYKDLDYMKGVAINLNNLGNAYVRHKEYEMAIEYFGKSLKIKEKINDNRGMAYTFNNIGAVYYHMRKYDDAIDYFNRSLEIHNEQGDKAGIASGTQNIGDCYFEKEEYARAFEQYEKALVIAEEIGDKRHIAQLLLNTGQLYWKNDQASKGMEYLEKSMKIAKAIGAKEDIKNAYKILSEFHEELKIYKKAHTYFKLYSQTKDSIFNEDKSKEIGKLEARYEFERSQEERKRLEENERAASAIAERRRNNLQYSGILIFIVLLFATVFGLGRLSLPVRAAEGIVFFAFLLFFEFTLVLLDPYIEEYSAGGPAIKLAFNAVLAAMIFPLHSFFETKLKSKLAKHE